MTQVNEFNLILDDCLDRLARGETLEECLAAHPQQAGELRPALLALSIVKRASAFNPNPVAKAAARERFYRATAGAASPTRRSFISRLAYWPVALAAVAAIAIIAVIGYNASQPGTSPYVPIASPQGNFMFLISDAVNAIGDFQSLNITIDKVGLLTGSGWIEFVPEIRTIDLTLLPGEKTQSIWQGDLPPGQYSKVFIYVSNVQGLLKATGQPVDVKLPGNKMQIDSSFSIGTGTPTSFTFDITVTASGNPKNGLHYMLKPQLDQSGASSIPVSGSGQDKGKSLNGK